MRSEMRQRNLVFWAAATGLALVGCNGSPPADGLGGAGQTVPNSNSPSTSSGRASDARRRYDLDTLPSAPISVNEHLFQVWIASEYDRQRPGVTNEGLMFVPAGEIADDQGMLFVMSERMQSFWMKNTIAPLDIAFARSDGTIVTIWQMPPLTLESFPSSEPAKYALELKQGTFERLGIKVGDQLALPDDLIK